VIVLGDLNGPAVRILRAGRDLDHENSVVIARHQSKLSIS
jgi:hypothetical protein